eukprot:NODE_166_length_14584_cov_1.124750.p6 type:complete len:286 gc:universal NODE_166_length_14584_cov_1.124750:6616-5759(-)
MIEPISQVLVGCCLNVIELEKLLDKIPDIGITLTFFHFSIILLTYHKKLQLPLKVPLRWWIVMAALFWISNTLNNMAFGYKISVPLHIIVRSSSLVLTIIVGLLIGKRYTVKQTLSMILVTIGLICSTYQPEGWYFSKGLLLLFFGQLCSVILGFIQEHVYSNYGKHWEEALIVTHMIGTPVFSIFYKQIIRDVAIILQENLIWPFLVNILSQLICIRGVNELATRGSALTLNLVLTLRKYISLLISMYMFGNSLTIIQITGSVLVVTGTWLYSRSPKIDRFKSQ